MDFFKPSDFRCKCDRKECDAKEMDSKTISLLNELRKIYSKPIFITSARRCIEHNRKVNGSENSYHLYGMAIDISVKNGEHAGKIVEKAILVGFTGIGVPRYGFIHLDTRPGSLCVFGY